MNENAKGKLDNFIAEMTKEFGKGALLVGNARVETPIMCSTGSVNLDTVIGIGGLPRGKIVEIYGPESAGKTTTCLTMIAQVQKMGGVVGFVDAEHALDLTWAKKIGCIPEEFLLSQPDNGEQALTIVERMVDSEIVDLIVVDSVAALTPRAEIEGEMGDSHMGLQARLMSQACRKLTGKIAKAGCTVIFTNQIRMKIGVMFGNPETTTGGNALKFYASLRLEVRKGEPTKKGDEVTGTEIKIKVVKNKMAPPFKKTTVNLEFGSGGIWGFNPYKEVLTLGVEAGVISKSGTWFTYGTERVGQGAENAAKFLMDNTPIFEDIRSKIIAKYADTTEVEIGNSSLEEETPPDALEGKIEEATTRKRRPKSE